MEKSTKISRRNFMKGVSASTAGLLILPSGTLFGQNTPNNKLNVALIGTWGRAEAHFQGLQNENVVALCDVNVEHLDFGKQQFPNAKTYADWRECLDQKEKNGEVC